MSSKDFKNQFVALPRKPDLYPRKPVQTFPKTLILMSTSIISKETIISKENSIKYFSDRLVWANSKDPDQTAPTGAV